MPTGCVSACMDRAAARFVQDAFMNDYFRVYTSYDIVGVELSGALKNVVALSCGICSGLGYQDNTKALLMTRGLAEMARLGVAWAGRRRPLPAWPGWATDRHLLLHALPEPPVRHPHRQRGGAQRGGEGDRRRGGGLLRRCHRPHLAQKVGIEMPIAQAAYEVLYEGRDVHAVVTELMSRAKRSETEESSWT